MLQVSFLAKLTYVRQVRSEEACHCCKPVPGRPGAKKAFGMYPQGSMASTGRSSSCLPPLTLTKRELELKWKDLLGATLEAWAHLILFVRHVYPPESLNPFGGQQQEGVLKQLVKG